MSSDSTPPNCPHAASQRQALTRHVDLSKEPSYAGMQRPPARSPISFSSSQARSCIASPDWVGVTLHPDNGHLGPTKYENPLVEARPRTKKRYGRGGRHVIGCHAAFPGDRTPLGRPWVLRHWHRSIGAALSHPLPSRWEQSARIVSTPSRSPPEAACTVRFAEKYASIDESLLLRSAERSL
jgi:hypothetical protein